MLSLSTFLTYRLPPLADMGPLALPGEPVGLRDALRHDWSLVSRVRVLEAGGEQSRTSGGRSLRLGAQSRQHTRRAAGNPRTNANGLFHFFYLCFYVQSDKY